MVLSFAAYTLAALLVGYALAAVWIYARQSRRVYRPRREMITHPGLHGHPWDDITLRTDDGVRLNAWYVPTPGARRVLMFFHGNTRNISHCMDSIALFQRFGFNVFLFDYRGYGRSEGVPDELGTYLDARAAWEYLLRERGFAPDDVVLLGRSLGAAIATWLAARHAPRALVIESTFISLPEVAADHHPWLPVRLLTRYHYPVADNLARVRCPVLVVHSRDDEIVPFRHAERFVAAAGGPATLLEIRGRHYDGYRASAEAYEAGLAAFLGIHAGARTPAPERGARAAVSPRGTDP